MYKVTKHLLDHHNYPLTTAEMAMAMGLSINTVKQQVRHAKQSLEIEAVGLKKGKQGSCAALYQVTPSFAKESAPSSTVSFVDRSLIVPSTKRKRGLPISENPVFLFLHNRYQEDRFSFYSGRMIGDVLKSPRRTIQKHLTKLKVAGILDVTKEKDASGGASIPFYRLNAKHTDLLTVGKKAEFSHARQSNQDSFLNLTAVNDSTLLPVIDSESDQNSKDGLPRNESASKARGIVLQKSGEKSAIKRDISKDDSINQTEPSDYHPDFIPNKKLMPYIASILMGESKVPNTLKAQIAKKSETRKLSAFF